MIEKLPQNIILPRDANGHKTPVFFMWDKINELCETVNDITDWIKRTDETIVKYGIKPIPEKIAQGFKNLQDPYAEQRKWIGHLVEHNTPDNDSGNGYGILTAIYPGKVYPFEINGGEYYAHSVRLPRADILYGIG